MRLHRMFLYAFLGLCLTLPANADTLATQTGGRGSGTSFLGESFTVTGTGQFNNISFNFYNTSQTSEAVGDLYLFSSAYAGSPSGLASASGAIGVAAASNNVYTFDSSVILTAGQQYFAYTDASFTASVRVIPDYAGGQLYLSTSETQDFYTPKEDANFTVTGTEEVPSVATAPEPASWALMMTGITAIVVAFRRRNIVAWVRRD